jgi:predicted metalloprotease
MGFFDELSRRFGAPGDFAQAYVIAHEFGHHVQTLLGIEGGVRKAMEQNPSQEKALSVRLELQADCLAGVWAYHSDQRWKSIEPGDVQAALQTASAIGDDRLQKQSQGYVVPDAFTHGTSEQRQRWFTKGLKEGKISSCDTFAAAQL